MQTLRDAFFSYMEYEASHLRLAGKKELQTHEIFIATINWEMLAAFISEKDLTRLQDWAEWYMIR